MGSTEVQSFGRDPRVHDFLGDKLQTAADLGSLVSLLSILQAQHQTLGGQLEQARNKLSAASTNLNSRYSILQNTSQAFDRSQSNIDRRLAIINNSDTSDDAIFRFQSGMDKLKSLEIASKYLGLAEQATRLRSTAIEQSHVSRTRALRAYRELHELSTTLEPLQVAAENAAPFLIEHVEKLTAETYDLIRELFTTRLDDILRRIDWPNPSARIPDTLKDAWYEGVNNLLDLQMPQLLNASTRPNREPLVLLPVKILVHPLDLRFQYHFEGDRPTNRLDKPEYFLSHVQGLITAYSGFFMDQVQPILFSRFKGSDPAFSSIYVDAVSALINALLSILRPKIRKTMGLVSAEPQLFSHFIHELMAFDSSVREQWSYDAGYGVQGWKGLTWEILAKEKWFDRWLHVEKEFALRRYQDIVDSPESFELDYESVDSQSTKPTKAAIRVNDLVETITDRYRELSSFSQKLRFLIDIQILLFDRFHERLYSSLEAYITMTSSIASTVHGISRDEQMRLRGLEGLERLCRVYGSADYLEKAMRDRSDDLFFLELWEELQGRASSRTTGIIAGSMTTAEVAGKTSAAVGVQQDSGALFDETAGAYRSLRYKTEEQLIETVVYSVREYLKPYSRINTWSTLAAFASDGSAGGSITAELDSVIQLFATSFGFLSRAIARAPLLRISREVSRATQTIIWDNVLLRHTFSTTGARQFSYDLQCLWNVIDHATGIKEGQYWMQKLAEGVTLLGLPPRTVNDQVSDSQVTIGLSEAESMVFRDNTSARQLLDELGLELLSENDARSILKKRIETNY